MNEFKSLSFNYLEIMLTPFKERFFSLSREFAVLKTDFWFIVI
jgi:hypothetical protein